MVQNFHPQAIYAPNTQDRVRQVAVIAAQIFCLIGTLVGVGVFGTEVEQTAGGRLSASATLIAPHGPAFSIWSVIYVGLFAFTVWHSVPRNGSNTLARMVGWLAAWSMILNAAWLLVVQRGWLIASVGVIVALFAVLFMMIWRVTRGAHGDDGSLAHRAIFAPTFGLYLGWVSVATCANIAATLVARGAPGVGPTATAITIAVLAIVAGLGVAYQRWFSAANETGLSRNNIATMCVLGAAAWGCVWIAVGRAVGPTLSAPVMYAAFVVAAVFVALLLATAAVRRPVHREPNAS